MTLETGTGDGPGREPMTALEYLRSRPQWVAWKYKQRSKGGKPTKPPINPHNGKTAKVSDSTTWGTYEQAEARRALDNLAGVGYVLTVDDRLAGGDLDHVRNPVNGVLVDWAQAIVDMAETYIEVSPSGTGLRLLWIGKPESAVKNDRQQVEIYGEGRYLTITGDRLPNCPDEILPAPRTRDALLARAAVLSNGNGHANGHANGSGNGHVHVEDAFDKLNTAALQDLKAWVPELFGDKAKPSARGGYRVPSKELGRDTEEDISITVDGIVDFGVHDMGDEREGRRTPIGLVMEHSETETTHDEAVAWLCKWLGVSKPGILLDPEFPMTSSRALMKSRFTTEGGLPILHRHRETFWIWKDNYYNIIGDETMEQSLWRFLETALRKGKKGARPFGPKRSHVGDCVASLGAVCAVDPFIELPTWLKEKDMPPANEFLVCANGLLHVPTRTLYQSTPDYFCVSASKVVYDEEAPTPDKWLAYLDEVLGDAEAIQLAQEWTGYLLVPDTSQQKILYCEGPKRSGKGTFARVITALLGKDSVGGPTMNSLAESFGLEPLLTKPVAIISDARIGAHTNKSSVVERLLSISGEDTMSVNRKNKQHWNGTLPTRFIIMTNEAPALMEGSGALAGRLLGLIFQVSFYGREDMELTKKLTQPEVLSGILNWAIEGYVRLRARGRFVQPRNALDKIEEIEILGAPIKAFIKDECDVRPGLQIHSDVLFDRWKLWNDREGAGRPTSKTFFGKSLASALPGVTTRRLGPQGVEGLFYIGIALRPVGQPAPGDIPF